MLFAVASDDRADAETAGARVASAAVVDVAAFAFVIDLHGLFHHVGLAVLDTDQVAVEAGDGAESFDFLFRFAFGTQHVNITFLRSAKNNQIKILVNRFDEA